jgi:hypothetical protein
LSLTKLIVKLLCYLLRFNHFDFSDGGSEEGIGKSILLAAVIVIFSGAIWADFLLVCPERGPGCRVVVFFALAPTSWERAGGDGLLQRLGLAGWQAIEGVRGPMLRDLFFCKEFENGGSKENLSVRDEFSSDWEGSCSG